MLEQTANIIFDANRKRVVAHTNRIVSCRYGQDSMWVEGLNGGGKQSRSIDCRYAMIIKHLKSDERR